MLRISSVSYINSVPFVYGISNYKFTLPFQLELDTPADCAKKLITNQVDIGLVPVAILPNLKNYHIIGDFCIGAENDVKTVVLLSNVPFHEVKNIYLDYQSRSSVALTRVLAKEYWKRDFNFKPAPFGFEEANYDQESAIVLIGDRVFQYEHKFKYTIDLAREWIDFTGLPFVFAAWTSNKTIDPNFITEFNQALKFGLEHVPEALKSKLNGSINQQYEDYLNKNISYKLDQKKREGLELFLSKLKEL